MRVLHSVPVMMLLLAAGVSGCLGGSGGTDGDDPSATGDGSGNGTLTANFAFEPSNPVPLQPIRFTDLSQDADFDIVHHAWDFGDGRGTTQANPVHAFDAPGVYSVTLRVKNAAGTERAATKSLPVRDAPPAPPPTTSLPPGGNPPPGVDGFPEFGDPVTVRGVNGGEPVVTTDSEGRFYVNPIGELYVSDDGTTFRELPYPVVFSGDSHAVVDQDDRIWVSDLGGLTPPVYGSSSVWVSEDGGQNWLGNPVASDTVLNDRQWLAATEGGEGFLLYRHCTVLVPEQGCISVGSALTKTTNAGLTWQLSGRFFEWTSFPFTDPDDGTLYIVQVNDQENAIDVATSTNGGTSFSQVRVTQRATTPGSIFVVGAVDDGGNAYVTWIDRDSSQFDVWMAYSTNKGLQWSQPVLVSSGVGTAVFPWIAAGADGKVAVAWYGTDAVGAPDEIPAGTPWYVEVAVSRNAHDAHPVFAQSRATGAVHTGPICTVGSGCDGTDRDLLDFLSVAVAPDGRIALAYGEDHNTSTTKTQFLLQTGGPLLR